MTFQNNTNVLLWRLHDTFKTMQEQIIQTTCNDVGHCVHETTFHCSVIELVWCMVEMPQMERWGCKHDSKNGMHCASIVLVDAIVLWHNYWIASCFSICWQWERCGCTIHFLKNVPRKEQKTDWVLDLMVSTKKAPTMTICWNVATTSLFLAFESSGDHAQFLWLSKFQDCFQSAWKLSARQTHF